MKSQIAYEYFLVIGFFFSILTFYIVYLQQLSINYSQENKIRMAVNSLNKIGKMVDWINFQGEPAKVSINVFIPEEVISMEFRNNTIIWKFKGVSGISDLVYYTAANVSLNISKRGELPIIIEAKQNFVKVYVG